MMLQHQQHVQTLLVWLTWTNGSWSVLTSAGWNSLWLSLRDSTEGDKTVWAVIWMMPKHIMMSALAGGSERPAAKDGWGPGCTNKTKQAVEITQHTMDPPPRSVASTHFAQLTVPPPHSLHPKLSVVCQPFVFLFVQSFFHIWNTEQVLLCHNYSENVSSCCKRKQERAVQCFQRPNTCQVMPKRRVCSISAIPVCCRSAQTHLQKPIHFCPIFPKIKNKLILIKSHLSELYTETHSRKTHTI